MVLSSNLVLNSTLKIILKIKNSARKTDHSGVPVNVFHTMIRVQIAHTFHLILKSYKHFKITNSNNLFYYFFSSLLIQASFYLYTAFYQNPQAPVVV